MQNSAHTNPLTSEQLACFIFLLKIGEKLKEMLKNI